MITYAQIDAALHVHGLIARGGYFPVPEDGVPPLAGGRPVRTLVLAGNVGPEMWQAFTAAPEFATEPNPLDRWAQRVLGEVAAEMGGEALFPFGGPPYRPFVAWAKRAEPVAESPLGILIHPDYGLWHAYRGALLFADAVDIPARNERPFPCDSCVDKPCLSTCPVNAFMNPGYNVPVCAGHMVTPSGADCLAQGCRARRACPVGPEFLYAPAQAELHMRAFLLTNRPPEPPE
ncbi:MAG: ferredoxin [Alphaproteobacteria bacterium]